MPLKNSSARLSRVKRRRRPQSLLRAHKLIFLRLTHIYRSNTHSRGIIKMRYTPTDIGATPLNNISRQLGPTHGATTHRVEIPADEIQTEMGKILEDVSQSIKKSV